MKKNFIFLDIILRYSLIFLAGLNGLYIFYKIFYPLTFNLSFLLLSLFGEAKSFYNLNFILFNKTVIEIIDACVAGSAYYLLFVLILSVRELKILDRFKLIIFTFGSLLLLNICRIVLMGLIAGSKYFDTVHLFFWYFISIIFVASIWFLAVSIFKIKQIPIYSDIKYLFSIIRWA